MSLVLLEVGLATEQSVGFVIAPLRRLGQVVSTCRGLGLVVETVWQDFAQIRRIYGPAAEEVKSNHIAKLYMKGISDIGTLNELSAWSARRSTPQSTTAVTCTTAAPR